MKSTNNEAHPIELLLMLTVVVIEAAAVLVAALVALLLTMARWRPAAPPPTPAQSAPAAPQAHPLVEVAQTVADGFAGSTVAQLRQRARAAGLPRSITRTGRRAELLEALVAIELATA